MSSWEQREVYLVEVAQRCLRGHQSFELCRSHLVAASQISKGTIYNHFTTEADLVVAVACAQYQGWLRVAESEQQRYTDPFECYLFHHCQRLYDVLAQKRFVIERLMPNQELLQQASEVYRDRFNELLAQYCKWNQNIISAVGERPGFDRYELLKNYIRGTMINSDDGLKRCDDVQTYYQFSYAMAQLMGHSDRRIPSKQTFSLWLQQIEQQHTNAAA
ncbi:TetR/AcrR family transcriptional regulator [Shewanella rhizosphaerae]|uniref:TetR/AcrR family transcriptional regulator n=1 Tax=Shewanella rhizosphaerae TaxID=2864207 RepID=UPI001C658925|nr:TetR/AcrR family transcriptional regulator [Shewanella rhizosphaerae]QYK12681.1 TetR/AcrR family transcriptional regulator [Shewanella rhizosphaerae]